MGEANYNTAKDVLSNITQEHYSSQTSTDSICIADDKFNTCWISRIAHEQQRGIETKILP